ncbi:Methyl- binding domain [Brachionus plicatilis]|uniref:Methyl-binding domain n=1 Tax=Brachionus plicatilis TaxID=10195 RepID=A0A3M7RU44_BRAPC|nr:Methyl- binding domain [Brachionus plicatilis]
MKRNFDAPEPKPDSSNHVNGTHLSSIFNPNTGLFQNMFTDVSAFNQHLINNLTTSLFLEQQNVWSKLIADLGLGSSLMTQNFSLLDSNAKPCEAKKAKNSFSISDIIQQSEDSPLNLSKTKNGVNSLTSLSKKSPEPAQNRTNDASENQNESVNRDLNLIESKLRLALKIGYRFRRETIVRELTNSGVKGDIIYYSPCGRKLRNFQEIERGDFFNLFIKSKN